MWTQEADGSGMYGPEDGNAPDRLDVGVEISSCVVGDVRVAHSSPQESLCICYATESVELELDDLHKACILEEAAQAVNDDTG